MSQILKIIYGTSRLDLKAQNAVKSILESIIAY